MASYAHSHDVTSAEFIRTYRSVDFPGGQLVQRLENGVRADADRTSTKVLPGVPQPQEGESRWLRHFADVYGYRGFYPEYSAVYFLSPMGIFDVVAGTAVAKPRP